MEKKRLDPPQPTSESPLSEVISALQDGELIIVVDDKDRENEGDLVLAAEKVTPEKINFMTQHGRGLVCVAMSHALLTPLGITQMPSEGRRGRFNTAFMESVDASQGITTGISAFDRARTIEILTDPGSRPSDLVRPGHIFPLRAAEGGVLKRAGHTEASVDLMQIAGLRPAAVICEILNADGNMARTQDLRALALKHDLKVISVEDVMAHRLRTEVCIEKERQVNLPTKFGDFQLHMYRSMVDEQHHLALVAGAPEEVEAPLVRVHSECLTGDAFGSLRCDCGFQLQGALQMVAEEGAGVVVYMRQEGRGIGLAQKIHAYALQEHGLDTVEANHKLGFKADQRDYGASAQILSQLGLQKVRLITNNPHKIESLEKYGLEIVERIPLVRSTTQHNEDYLNTKKTKLGHLL